MAQLAVVEVDRGVEERAGEGIVRAFVVFLLEILVLFKDVIRDGCETSLVLFVAAELTWDCPPLLYRTTRPIWAHNSVKRQGTLCLTGCQGWPRTTYFRSSVLFMGACMSSGHGHVRM